MFSRNTYLDQLESKSIYLIREAYARFRKTALLWSIGKDSTTLLWLCRKAFLGRLPFPVIHIDTSFKIPEIYDFRDRYKQKWDLDLIVAKNTEALAQGCGPQGGRLECCNALKTEALKMLLRDKGFDALLLGIRRDEHGIRAKERYVSPRDQSFTWNYQQQPIEMWDLYQERDGGQDHSRIHPLLDWTEIDVWRYIQREGLPVVSCYFAKQGKRYRSIGCSPCCEPVPSQATTIGKIIKELEKTRTPERSGRAQDKEDAYAMEKLRSLGYM